MTSFLRRYARRFARDERGAAMVEFAILAPLLFLLIFGIIDFGRVFFLYNNLTNAAREGARYGAVLPTTTPAATIRDYVRARINDNGAATADVQIDYPGTNPAQNIRVRIVNYPFTPFTFFAIRSARQLNVAAQFRAEYQ